MRHTARRRFGQNFLHDPQVIGRIVNALDPQPGQALVEIGPGLGALTEPVIAAAGHLHAVEIDRDLAAALRQRFSAQQLTLHEADALQFDFARLAENGRLRIFGNLPYNISTPMLFHLLECQGKIRDMLFMLQKEVVDRITAPVGSKAYGRLSVMLAIEVRAERLFTIGPGAFRPPPKVHSAMVHLVPHQQPLVAAHARRRLAQIVTQAFSRRRKTLRNALHGLVAVEQMLAQGLDPGQRPETVEPKQFAALAQG